MIAILPNEAENAALISWAERIGGGKVVEAQRISGGAYRISCRLTLEDGADHQCLFLKIDTGSAPKTPFDLEREYQVLAALDGRARAPRALGYDANLHAMAMECLPGNADYQALPESTRDAVERSFAKALHEVHEVDLQSLALDHLPAGRTVRQAIVAELDLWSAILSRLPGAHDSTIFGLAWARRRMPEFDGPAVLVQGDAGPGNFLYDAEGVTGLVDWEMTHIGHPLEDLGCVLARSLVSPMGDAERLLDLYEQASGKRHEKADLLYATVLVMARFGVPIELALAGRDPRIDFGLMSGYHHVAEISMLRLIAQAEGIALDETVPERAQAPRSDFEFEYLRYVLNDIVLPQVTDDFARYRLQGAIGLAGYLENLHREPEVARDKTVLEEIADAEAVIETGGEALRARLQDIMSNALYAEHLMRPLLGPLHGRRAIL